MHSSQTGDRNIKVSFEREVMTRQGKRRINVKVETEEFKSQRIRENEVPELTLIEKKKAASKLQLRQKYSSQN